jgi:hypothetical protein
VLTAIFKDSLLLTPCGCFILALSVATITHELVHQHRALPFATLCLNLGYVQAVKIGDTLV